jgi:hypothetical protein
MMGIAEVLPEKEQISASDEYLGQDAPEIMRYLHSKENVKVVVR